MLRIVSKTRDIALEGEFAGGELTVRRNVPMAVILRLNKLQTDGDLEQIVDILPEIITRWNFADEAGAALPVTPEGARALPVDLFQAVMAAFNTVVGEEAAVSPN